MSNKNVISEESLTDKTLTCKDCGNLFLFTVIEQQQYLKNGLKHEPARCPVCRRKYREAIQATMEPVECRMCYKKGFVVQIPENQLDILCEECFLKIKKFIQPEV